MRESHEHGNFTTHGESFVFVNGTNGNVQSPSLRGRTSSDFWTTLSSFTSVLTHALSPNRRFRAKRYGLRFTVCCAPPFGACG